MPLDPAFAALLDRIAQAPPPDPNADPLVTVRAATTASFAHPGAPEVDVRELSMPGPDNNPVALRAYRPMGTAGAVLPVVVYFHGGGFIAGGLDSHDGTCRELTVAAGCAVVSVDYRLAPEQPFPAGLEDCAAAVRWVAAFAGDHGWDPDRVAIGGDSAGGNLAAAVALVNRDRVGPALVAQVLVYPVIDPACATRSMTANATGYMLTADSMRWMWSNYHADAGDVANPYLAPHRAPSHAGLPPAIVITAEFDPLRDEGDAYAAQLAAAGVSVVHSRYAGQVHGFFSMYPFAPQAAVATAEVGRFLRRQFGLAAPA